MVGLIFGVLAGGIISGMYGQPFSGTKGPQGFLGGLYFPGLVVFAPASAATTATLFLVGSCGLVLYSHSRGKNNK